ncbi:MAG: tRNA (cytidine(34)-2'-O)-methyltransferase [Pseudomonadota bacterium]|nr:tRNA (cytidine(34)-2'-O)-methyltransferase [Pseudomonadota bacterium]
MISVALFQPDIAPNVGAILRLAACLDVAVHIIDPAGFPWSEKSLRRAGLDYMEQARIFRHANFAGFRAAIERRRLVLLSTKAKATYTQFRFATGDVLLFGRETAGVPDAVHGAADARLTIPMRRGMRSLNVALACAMVAGEALRQTGAFPGETAEFGA